MMKELSDDEILKELMTVKGWTQVQLSEQLYIQQSTISKVINGKQKLSNAVRKVVEDLLAKENEKRLDNISGVSRFTADEMRKIVVAVFDNIWKERTSTKNPEIIRDFFHSFFYFLMKEVELFVDYSIKKEQVWEKFKIIRAFLELGGDNKSIKSHYFCGRIHHLKNTEQQIVFMQMIVCAFQNSPSEAIEKFSELEEQMTNTNVLSKF